MTMIRMNEQTYYYKTKKISLQMPINIMISKKKKKRHSQGS